jgi:hypothetical protein
MKKKKDIKIKFQAKVDDRISLKELKSIPEDLIVDYGQEIEKTRVKAIKVLDDLYKQMENEIVKHKEIDNDKYYILINYDDLHELYKASDMFIDINNIINDGFYKDEKKLLGIKALVSGDVKKAELVRKI